ncbi:MAG: trehalose-phosphatase [Dehalococcoidia bacterium]|nr:trehalose-phosphatase [Dehalococcoidia bacterium]
MRAAESGQLDLERIDAVIFDMDGVVTDTARTHAMAWKQMFDEFLAQRSAGSAQEFAPFDADQDYRLYVDGKPRYDGVRSFLESRGIPLPEGSPSDSPQAETIHGLGNRKNEYFLLCLKDYGAESFPSTVELVKQLKARGSRVAVISSSRNAEEVLEAAGVGSLFEVKVDGKDLETLGLKGKPEPDMFVEAARRLGVAPNRTAVIEDALAGVEAGRNGDFALVVGVARHGEERELLERGAHIVVADLSQLEVVAGPAAGLDNIPSALDKKPEIFARLRKGTPAVFLDYDGTLTPIVEHPAQAVLQGEFRSTLERLVERYPVVVISGRDLADVRKMVGIKQMIYAGSHGFDIDGPAGTYRDQGRGRPFLGALDRAEKALREETAGIPGAWVERKRFAIAVHFRKVDDALVGELEERVDFAASPEPELRKEHGKKIFELRPNVEWDKGTALLWMLDSLFVDGSRVVPIFIGDDVTDEYGFRAIKERGIGIHVGNADATAASYRLSDTKEVQHFLEGLIEFAEESVPGAWTLVYTDFVPEQEGLRESLCTLGNGFFGTRGAAPECEADRVHYPGTYVAGLYNRLKSRIAGRIIENESIVNVPNWLSLSFRLEDGKRFSPDETEFLDYRQELDLRRGVLSRFMRFQDERGRRTRVTQRRFVHMADQHLAGLETTFVAENWSGRCEVRSGVNGEIANTGVERYRQLNSQHLNLLKSEPVDEETVYLEVETNQSHIRIGEGVRTRISDNRELMPFERRLIQEKNYIGHEITFDLKEGSPVSVEKIAALFTSRDAAISEAGYAVKRALERASSFDDLLQSHVLYWDHLWQLCDISIRDRERNALVLHLHIFHLLQTASLNTIDLDVGVPPRGLHGEAYRGFIMWDELFVFPYLNLRIPDITRALLQYRYRRLPEARRAAKDAGYRGAMYPWQSGSDGREESQVLHLNPRSGRWIPDHSRLQRHINIAVAYNIWHYYQVTCDTSFLALFGAEIFIEVARFWASISKFNRSLQRYEICGIMGPDEYHDAYPDAARPGIDNNAYTNIMVVWVLCRALQVLSILPEDYREALCEKVSLRREEIELWDDMSRRMRVILQDDGIISQFEGYEELQEFDWEGYRERYGSIQRLDRILEAEGDTTNRYKLSKQADVLMLFYLLSADELRELFRRLDYKFEYETIPRNIEYYLKRTAHGSTLSRIVHSWVLARSQRELSWHLFKDALESDISDAQGGTTPEGIHLGAMAGTVDLIQRCYTGIETREDILWLNPVLPEELKSLDFHIRYRGHLIHLSFSAGRLSLSSGKSNASPVTIGIRDKRIEMKPGETRDIDLADLSLDRAR